MFTLLNLIVSVSLLLALGPSGAVLTVAQSQPASLVALVPAPAIPVAARAFGELSLSTPTADNRLVINGNNGRRRSDHSDPYAARTNTEWDDCDSRKWIGEPWGDSIEVDWVEFDGRKTLRARITPAGKSWAIMRTDAFPAENWETKTGLRADIYQAGGISGVDVKLEVRGPLFDPPDFIEEITATLQPNTWNTCTWNFNTVDNDYSAVSHLSMVFDHLSGSAPTFYVDNLRLVSAAGEEEWDDMDDGSRWWFYFGNWYDWTPDRLFGLEPISHNGGNPTTPAGSIYLQWDYENGCCYPLTTAEVGTSQLDDVPNWSGYNRISADIKVSDPDVPISVFIWDADAITTPVDYRGFGTPTRKVGVADSWQTITWDLPWPPWFDNTDIDEVKFVANNIDTHLTGALYLDNIYLISDTLPSPVTGLEYVFEDFNDRSEDFNDFNGNWGELNGGYITTTFDTSTYTGTWGASLKIDYDLPSESFTGIWQSLFGHSDAKTKYLDFMDIYGSLYGEANFEQIHFWVRGSGTTTGTHNVKIELKDIRDAYEYTAYRYITIDDSDTTWREVVLDADVTNSSFWSYNLHPPDPTRMKFLVFVIESYFNNPTGTFYIDDIHFVDADDGPFDLDQHTDDEFLDFVSEKTFLYFLDWYDQNTGLFQDRSTFPDLMSTAATGFGLTALTIGESRGWISRTLAIEMITRTLQTLHDGQKVTDTVTDTITGTNGYKGWYYHFLGEDGLRKDEGSELSSVDTAILMAGILTAREYFVDVQDIVNMADELYRRVEWDWMLDSGNNLFYMAWKPECGPGYEIPAPGGGCFTSKNDGSPLYWDYYTDEVILINLLAIGSPTHPVPPEVFYAWTREWGECEDKEGHTHRFIQSWNGSFFTYVFAHLWADFSILGTDNQPHPALQVDWWQNSVEAAWCNWQFAVDHQDDTACDSDDDYTTYRETSWGLTACDGPDGEYHAYGAAPAAVPPNHDGTIAPYGAGMAIVFLPEKAIPALKYYFANTDLWHYRFGFGDAYNLDPPDCNGPWYNHAAFGIDQGPMLIAIENYRSGLIWDIAKQNSYIWQALCAIAPLRYDLNGDRHVDIVDILLVANCWRSTDPECAPYDLDGDGDIDIVDIMLVASRWSTSCANPDPDNDPDTPNYDPLCDVDHDCDIDVVDIVCVAAHWREICG